MPMIIGALVAALLQGLRQYLPGIIGRVLLAFGIGFATHEIAMPALKSLIQGYIGGLPAVAYAYFNASGFGVATTMILSAWLANRAQAAILTKLKAS
ncbi:DUF2523 family protein [Xanthomonas sp. CFBP 8445]|uniref:DUF2523 family protein n=1 Tax=Xanthomonas sp. CFBP 8445 TaxID=2971236 RepID=UPI0021DFA17F|nr:DUF2523 family protein [Xanthomonas sp. CFBP 8445]UYC14016.1 DUF2523 domain-containing protein [Xanthomonas sp. CFBP 8445]